MNPVARTFTRLSNEMHSAYPLCFALANLCAAVLIFTPHRLDETGALTATFALLWTGGLVFVRCTYAAPRRALALRWSRVGLASTPYLRAHPLMRQLIDVQYLTYFAVLSLATVCWVHGA